MVNVDQVRTKRRFPAVARTTYRAALAVTGIAVLTGFATSPASAAALPKSHVQDKPVAASVLSLKELPAPHKITYRNSPKAPAKDHAAPAKAPKAKAPKAKRAAAPSVKQLLPNGIDGGQESFKPNAEQMANAKAIVQAGQKMKLPPRAFVIAVATSLQESALHNFGDLGVNNDHDSLGLFQQRPSSGWGTPKQVTNPKYASTMFYKGLVQVSGWDRMPLTEAAQSVQVSAFPDHYAKWEKHAADLVLAVYGHGPYAV